MEDEKIPQIQIEPLLNYIQNLTSLTEEEKQLIFDLFEPRTYRKRQYVLQEGDLCNQLSFIVRGCLRMYKVDDSGNMYILQFASENSWLSNIGSFYERKPSELNIDALEDTVVLQISYENLLFLYNKAPKFDRIFRVLIENSFVSLQKRLLQIISSSAEERYVSFVQEYAQLANRLPQTQIASFLGITPEFLSRIRNKQARKS
jgi:CRP-like cAMP-binding protein